MNLRDLYRNPKFVKLVDLLDDYDWNGFVSECGLIHEYDVEAKYIWECYKDFKKTPDVWVLTLAISEVFLGMLMMQPPVEECERFAKEFIKIMEG